MKKRHSMSVGAILYGHPDCPITPVPVHQGDHKGSPLRMKFMHVLIAAVAAVSIITSTACNAPGSGNTGSGNTGPVAPSPTSKARQGMPSPTASRSQGIASPTANAGSKEMRRPWSAIHNWTYWLNNPNLQQLAATNFELIVVDYSADGSAPRAFSSAQIHTLRNATCQRRVMAYLSIGQAESYRGYWQQGWRQGTPAWLDAPDPNWANNYWVHYWDSAWQQIIYRYIDDIIAAGFDGIYLDRVDAYEESYAAGHEDDMVRFIMNLAHYGRVHSPLGEDFGVIVQNAENLAMKHKDYVQTVTGIGREEVYIQATNRPTSASERTDAESLLDIFRQNSRGKLVLTIDYANQADLINTAYNQSRVKAYIPYVAPVGLDRLQMNVGYEPTCRSI